MRGFWVLPLVCVPVLWRAPAGSGSPASRSVMLLVAWVLPLATFGFAGQLVYHRVFSSYMGRDTLRRDRAPRHRRRVVRLLGRPWLAAALIVSGVGVTAGVLALIRRVAPRSMGRSRCSPC